MGRSGLFKQLLRLAVIGAAVWLCVTPTQANAQYKNTSFSLDAGYWRISKPTLLGDDGQFRSIDKRPLRLSNGLRLGVESSFKMDSDRFWFTGRAHVGFLRYGADPSEPNPLIKQYDELGAESLGTILGIQAGIHVRYYFLTDRFRPYGQLGLSYMRLFSFSNQAEATTTCDLGTTGAIAGGGLCGGTTSNYNNFLPHPNVGVVHFEGGLEMIFSRDVAFRVAADVQRWLVINTDDNVAVVLVFGITFYS